MDHNNSQAIQVLYVEPGRKARITTIKNDLESLQKMVGGYIEAVYPYEDPVAIVCNEEGKLSGMELNRALRDDAGTIYDILTGPFLVVGLGEEDFTSLSKAHQQKYQKLFEHPEMFFRVGNEIRAVKLETQERPRSTKHR